MEAEVNQKVTCLAIQSSEKTGRVFVHALSSFMKKQMNAVERLGKANQGNNKELKGKMVKIKDLRKDGSQIESLDMGVDEMNDFKRYARKYGVAYHMERNRSTEPPTYYIYFKAKDATLIKGAIEEYLTDKLSLNKEAGKESIAQKLIKAKERVGKQKAKVRNKEQVR